MSKKSLQKAMLSKNRIEQTNPYTNLATKNTSALGDDSVLKASHPSMMSCSVSHYSLSLIMGVSAPIMVTL